MTWGHSCRTWLWITVTCFFGAGDGFAQGLQRGHGNEDPFPEVGKLLGEGSGLQLSMDWQFFERVGSLGQAADRSFAPSETVLDWTSFQGLEFDELRDQVFELRAQGTSDDGRLPQLEVLLPRKLETIKIDTLIRMELRPLGFSGASYERPQAIRYDTELELGRNMGIGSWYSRPVVRINYTRYDFQDDRESLERSIPVLEWDNGWRLEKSWGASLKQIWEPRIHYLFVPRVPQDDLPNFDSRARAFGYDALFQSQRLTGRDRIGDANQASIGFSTSVLSGDNAREYLKAGVAQTVYFSPQQSLVGESSDMSQRGISDLASMIRARWGDTSVSSVMQWDPVSDELEAARAELSQAFGHQVLSLMHRKEGEARFTELAWDYQISRHFALTSRMGHSLGDHPGESLEAAVTYRGCGWSVLMDTRREWRMQSRTYDHSMNVLLVLDSLSEPAAIFCR